jgi:hypothetical protein
MTTNIFSLEKEISVLCVNADSFPDGIPGAFETLNQKLPSRDGRTYYGISWMDQTGRIIYKAAVGEIAEDNHQQHGLESYRIRNGTYISTMVTDFMQNVSVMAETFKKLLADPRVDKNGYCVEIYVDQKDVQCMVTLDPSTI